MNKVLIIDDDEILLNALSVYLHGQGFSILSTADGPHGIMMYKNEKPDVVILDVGLPSMDGRDVLAQILNYDKNAKIIVVTGDVSVQIKEEVIKIGAYGFFSKPFDIILLIDKMNSALNSAKR